MAGTDKMTDVEKFNYAIKRGSSKVDGILEGPESRTATEEPKKWRSKICDDCCSICPAAVHNGGKCHGTEHMAEYDEAKLAMMDLKIYAEQSTLFAGREDSLITLEEAIEALDPALENPHLKDPGEALGALMQTEKLLAERQVVCVTSAEAIATVPVIGAVDPLTDRRIEEALEVIKKLLQVEAGI